MQVDFGFLLDLAGIREHQTGLRLNLSLVVRLPNTNIAVVTLLHSRIVSDHHTEVSVQMRLRPYLSREVLDLLEVDLLVHAPRLEVRGQVMELSDYTVREYDNA